MAVDLFSGSGGTSAGLVNAGIEVKVAIEINKTAVKTYGRNLNAHIIEKDIQEVTGKEILNKVERKMNEDLLLVACPPCQGFSSIGNGTASDIRNQLVFQFVRLVSELKPEYLLMENVSGMARGKGKNIFAEVLKQLDDLGYQTEYNILNAADYGVPQTRKRLVLHGIRNDIHKKMVEKGIDIELPKQTNINPSIEENPLGLPLWRTTQDVFNLPELKAGEKYEGPGVYNHFANGLSDVNRKKIRYIRAHGGSRSCLPEHMVLKCHKDKNGHGDVYGIIDLLKPAPTMTGGCMSYTKGRFGHPRDDRAISAREAARIQSFDDDFIFEGTNGEIALQIGNAVPVKLAEASGKYFVKVNKIINGVSS